MVNFKSIFMGLGTGILLLAYVLLPINIYMLNVNNIQRSKALNDVKELQKQFNSDLSQTIQLNIKMDQKIIELAHNLQDSHDIQIKDLELLLSVQKEFINITSTEFIEIIKNDPTYSTSRKKILIDSYDLLKI